MTSRPKQRFARCSACASTPTSGRARHSLARATHELPVSLTETTLRSPTLGRRDDASLHQAPSRRSGKNRREEIMRRWVRPSAAVLAVALMFLSGVTAYASVMASDAATTEVEVREYQGERLGSVDGFRENSISGVQTVDPETYRLAVDGLVLRPLSMSLQALAEFQRAEKLVTIHCVEGWSVKALWGRHPPERSPCACRSRRGGEHGDLSRGGWVHHLPPLGRRHRPRPDSRRSDQRDRASAGERLPISTGGRGPVGLQVDSLGDADRDLFG